MDEWYDAEENEPDEGEEVLITGLREDDERYRAVAMYSDGTFSDEDGMEYINVSHWSYLPDTDEL